MENLDWSLIPSFLAVADKGSLSAASRSTGISQPTIGRHIRSLEQTTKCELFHRRTRGLELTEEGAALVPAARAMAEAAAHLGLAASGQTATLAGTVRISASVFVSHYLLPPVIAAIRAEEPDIQIELVASDTTENLLYREADIAIRMYRPEQLDVIARQIGELPIGLFASTAYLDTHGEPQGFEDFGQHIWVGYDRDERIVERMRELGIAVGRNDFAIRCDAQTVNWELIRAGCGIGAGQLNLGRSDPGLRQVLPDLPIASLPVWLAAPEVLRRTPRLRRIWDLLADKLRPLVS